MPRRHPPVERRLVAEPDLLHAEVHEGRFADRFGHDLPRDCLVVTARPRVVAFQIDGECNHVARRFRIDLDRLQAEGFDPLLKTLVDPKVFAHADLEFPVVRGNSRLVFDEGELGEDLRHVAISREDNVAHPFALRFKARPVDPVVAETGHRRHDRIARIAPRGIGRPDVAAQRPGRLREEHPGPRRPNVETSVVPFKFLL